MDAGIDGLKIGTLQPSTLSIAGVGCALIGAGSGEEQVRKVDAGEASRCGADK
jgi:hypothetical protein